MAVSPVQVAGLPSTTWIPRRPSANAAPEPDPRNVLGAPDEATFSADALARADTVAEPSDSAPDSSGDAGRGEKSRPAGDALTEEQQREVDKLKSRDAAVRAHEAAHMAAGGSHVRGGASYSYQQGPDGKQYAIGGEVGIDVSSVSGNPQATIQKMQQVRAAALAPAEPSGADRAVAAQAAQAEARARAQLVTQRTGAAAGYAGASAAQETSPAARRLEATA